MTSSFKISDGKRSIIVETSDDFTDEVDIHICRNGFQTTVITVDPEMLVWVRDCCNRYIKKENQDD
jgi:hypothetical protein